MPGDLERPPIAIIGDPVTRVRQTLAGISASPRRRATLIIIQAVTAALAAGVFSYLIFRRH